jgi:hypothetical protein
MYRDEALNERISRFFELSAKAVISVVVVAIFVTILAGTAYTVYDFRLIFTEPFHEAFRTILIDILTVLAIMRFSAQLLPTTATEGSRSPILLMPCW